MFQRINRHLGFLAVSLLTLFAITLSGCGEKSAEDKVKEQASKVHALTEDERALANANGKAFFEKPWAPAGGKQGQFISCRPSDSNFNGLVTCSGFIPQPDGSMPEIKRYCGYRADLVGCSDEDTVK
jgi:hypothetical protein